VAHKLIPRCCYNNYGMGDPSSEGSGVRTSPRPRLSAENHVVTYSAPSCRDLQDTKTTPWTTAAPGFTTCISYVYK
jgi:hypothetical protein